MERDRAELERKVVDICKEARRRNAEAAQSDLISGHGDPPRMAPRNNEIRGRWPSRSRIDDDDDVRQTRYWVVVVSRVFWSGPIPVIWRGETAEVQVAGRSDGRSGD